MAVELGARVERHVRLARIAVAKNDQPAGRHRLRQRLVAADGGQREGLQATEQCREDLLTHRHHALL
jgi:hypothetical protein